MIINLGLSPASIVTGVGVCVLDGLAQTPAGSPDRQCLLLPTGSIPWDCCAPGGQFAQAITSVYGSDRFPIAAEGKDWQPCGPPWTVVRVLLSVTRCVTPMDEQGQPPPCATALTEAVTLENDRTAIRQALACCLTDLKTTGDIFGWAMGPADTVGESGGCAGIEVPYWFSVKSCLCGRL